MTWTRHGTGYVSDCDRVTLRRHRGQWWVYFDPVIAPNGIIEHPADTLRQAKAIAEGVIEHADRRNRLSARQEGLHAEIYKRLSDGERYRAALQAIRMRCEASESVDSAGLMWLVDEALEPGARMRCEDSEALTVECPECGGYGVGAWTPDGLGVGIECQNCGGIGRI